MRQGWKLRNTTFASAWAVPGVMSPEQIAKLSDNAQAFPEQDAVVTRGTEREVNNDVRRSKLRWLWPTDETQWVFELLSRHIVHANSEVFHLDIDQLVDQLQFTEYHAEYQGNYDAHVDNTYTNTDDHLVRRKLSFTLQLSDPASYEGGDLELYPSSLQPSVAPRAQGTLILFRSHIIHRVLPVTKGVRYSLVGWASGPLPS